MNNRWLWARRFPPVILWALLMVPRGAAAQDAAAGKVVYDKWCASCHGETGIADGEGATRMLPPPRDFTGAVYQIRTTMNGELPSCHKP